MIRTCTMRPSQTQLAGRWQRSARGQELASHVWLRLMVWVWNFLYPASPSLSKGSPLPQKCADSTMRMKRKYKQSLAGSLLFNVCK